MPACSCPGFRALVSLQGWLLHVTASCTLHSVHVMSAPRCLSCSFPSCGNRFALIRNFAGWKGFDGWARNAMFKILGEDKVMVEKLTPERLAAEFSLGPDAPQVSCEEGWADVWHGRRQQMHISRLPHGISLNVSTPTTSTAHGCTRAERTRVCCASCWRDVPGLAWV